MVNDKIVAAQETVAQKAIAVYAFIDFVLLFPLAAKLIFFTGYVILPMLIGLVLGLLGVILLVFGIFPFFASSFKGNAVIADIDRLDKLVGSHASQIETAVEQNKGAITGAIDNVAK